MASNSQRVRNHLLLHAVLLVLSFSLLPGAGLARVTGLSSGQTLAGPGLDSLLQWGCVRADQSEAATGSLLTRHLSIVTVFVGRLVQVLEHAGIVQDPSWWTLQRALSLFGLTGLFILSALLWVVMLRRRVQNQTETIRATLESTEEGIMVVDERGKITAFNEKFEELWAVPKSVLASRDESKVVSYRPPD